MKKKLMIVFEKYKFGKSDHTAIPDFTKDDAITSILAIFDEAVGKNIGGEHPAFNDWHQGYNERGDEIHQRIKEDDV